MLGADTRRDLFAKVRTGRENRIRVARRRRGNQSANPNQLSGEEGVGPGGGVDEEAVFHDRSVYRPGVADIRTKYVSLVRATRPVPRSVVETDVASAYETFLSDLRAPVARDPAAEGWLDVLVSYPGFHALVAHRVIHRLWKAKIPILPRFLAEIVHSWTGVDIHPGATIGQNVFIDHGTGVVIGSTAIVGDGTTLYQGVTLGGTSLQHTKRHPTLGKNVTVGSGAAILGDITIGDNVKVGANSVVVKDVPANATVVGIPGRVVLQDGKPVAAVSARPHVDFPDPNAPLIAELAARVAELERRLAELEGPGEMRRAR